MREAAQIYFGKNDTKDNKIVLKLDDNLPPISADYARIMQVVTNLLSNSLRHTENGIIEITLKKQSFCQLISVSDNGDGMTEEIKAKAFDGYVSVSKEYWRHGIGLYVCRKIVEAHGGKIWIESVLGRGTEISFTLPYAEEK